MVMYCRMFDRQYSFDARKRLSSEGSQRGLGGLRQKPRFGAQGGPAGSSPNRWSPIVAKWTQIWWVRPEPASRNEARLLDLEFLAPCRRRPRRAFPP